MFPVGHAPNWEEIQRMQGTSGSVLSAVHCLVPCHEWGTMFGHKTNAEQHRRTSADVSSNQSCQVLCILLVCHGCLQIVHNLIGFILIILCLKLDIKARLLPTPYALIAATAKIVNNCTGCLQHGPDMHVHGHMRLCKSADPCREPILAGGVYMHSTNLLFGLSMEPENVILAHQKTQSNTKAYSA